MGCFGNPPHVTTSSVTEDSFVLLFQFFLLLSVRRWRWERASSLSHYKGDVRPESVWRSVTDAAELYRPSLVNGDGRDFSLSFLMGSVAPADFRRRTDLLFLEEALQAHGHASSGHAARLRLWLFGLGVSCHVWGGGHQATAPAHPSPRLLLWGRRSEDGALRTRAQAAGSSCLLHPEPRAAVRSLEQPFSRICWNQRLLWGSYT